jgi:hypothetical protein
VTKETLSQKTYPGYFTDPENFSDLIDRYRIYRKKPNLLPENISLTKESIHMDFTITKYSDVSTGDELTIVVQRRDNADFSNKFIYLKKQKCLLKKTESCDGLDWIGYNVSEDRGNTYEEIDRYTFNYLLRKNTNLSEIKANPEFNNPKHIFFTKELWNSLAEGFVPDKYIGRIKSREYESADTTGTIFTDIVSKDKIDKEWCPFRSCNIQTFDTPLGTYEMHIPSKYYSSTKNTPNTYYFTPLSVYRGRSEEKIQITVDKFFEILENQTSL